VSGSGISWGICKSAPRTRQITMPAPHHSVFYRPDALPAAQPRASKHWRPNDAQLVELKLKLTAAHWQRPRQRNRYTERERDWCGEGHLAEALAGLLVAHFLGDAVDITVTLTTAGKPGVAELTTVTAPTGHVSQTAVSQHITDTLQQQQLHHWICWSCTNKKDKGSPYSTAEHRVQQLIPVLGSQPAGDIINQAVGCHYFLPGPQLPLQPLRGLLAISLLGEQRHDGCEQFA